MQEPAGPQIEKLTETIAEGFAVIAARSAEVDGRLDALDARIKEFEMRTDLSFAELSREISRYANELPEIVPVSEARIQLASYAMEMRSYFNEASVAADQTEDLLKYIAGSIGNYMDRARDLAKSAHKRIDAIEKRSGNVRKNSA